MATPSIEQLFAARLLLRADAKNRKLKMSVKDHTGISVTIVPDRVQDFSDAGKVKTAERNGAKGSVKIEDENGNPDTLSTKHEGKEAGKAVADLLAVRKLASGKMSADEFIVATTADQTALGYSPDPVAGAVAGTTASGPTADAGTTASGPTADATVPTGTAS